MNFSFVINAIIIYLLFIIGVAIISDQICKIKYKPKHSCSVLPIEAQFYNYNPPVKESYVNSTINYSSITPQNVLQNENYLMDMAINRIKSQNTYTYNNTSQHQQHQYNNIPVQNPLLPQGFTIVPNTPVVHHQPPRIVIPQQQVFNVDNQYTYTPPIYQEHARLLSGYKI